MRMGFNRGAAMLAGAAAAPVAAHMCGVKLGPPGGAPRRRSTEQRPFLH
jgi:hypothetical protein